MTGTKGEGQNDSNEEQNHGKGQNNMKEGQHDRRGQK